MEAIATLLTAACGGFVMAKTVTHFLTPASGRVKRILPGVLFAVTLANASWIGDENPLILFIFFIAAFLTCYSGTWYARLVTGTIFFSLLEPLCMMIDTANFSHRAWQVETFLPLLAKLAVWALLWILARRMVPKGDRLSLSTKLWGLLGALSLAPLFSTLSFSIWNANWSAKNFDYATYLEIIRRIAYTVLPFTMLSALALLIAMVVLSRHEALERRQKLAEVQEVYYQGLQREQAGVRILRHDLHNHIAACQGLLEGGDIAAAKKYLDTLSQSPALTGGKRYCENNIANAVISSKAALMEQSGINSDIQVSLPVDIPVPDAELCSLLGNALDNAIEAAGQAEEKRVTLRARADKGMLMLRVNNTLAKMPTQKDGKLITGKKDSLLHGHGFPAMEEIARRHGGACDAEYTEQEFCLLVSIPL